MSSPDDLLNVTQAAEELGMVPRTLSWRIKNGKVAAVKVGNRLTSSYAITRAEVDRLKGERAAKVAS